MKCVLYLNRSCHRISGHANKNDHDRWTGKCHYVVEFSLRCVVPMDIEDSFFRKKILNRDFFRLVMHTSWKTCGVPRVSCFHGIYRGLRFPLFRKGCKRRADAACRRSLSMIRYICRFMMWNSIYINSNRPK